MFSRTESCVYAGRVLIADEGVCMEAHVTHNGLDRVREHVRVEPILCDGHLGSPPVPRTHQSLPTGTLIGNSPQWLAVLKRAGQVAVTEATTCLQGESGTGKEEEAGVIHLAPRRGRGPFVAIHRPALPAGLFQSAVFACGRGA